MFAGTKGKCRSHECEPGRGLYRPRHRAATMLMAAVVLALVAAGCGTSASGVQLRSGGGGSASVPALRYASSGGWGTTWSYSPFNSTFFGALDGFSLLQLAITQPPKFGTYVPQLATSWKVNGSHITLKLRKGVRWQDGKPFTSKDVVTTLLLQGTNGNDVWGQITAVRAPNPSTVVLDVKPGISSAVVLENVLGLYPIPASEYGRFVSPGLKQALFKYYSLPSTLSTKAAQATPEAKLLAGVFKKLSQFSPKTFIGDGPFRLTRVTVQSAVMKRWPGFYDSSKIRVPEIEFTAFTDDSSIYPAFFSHTVDFSNAAPTDNIIARIKRTPGGHYRPEPNYAQVVQYFNSRQYPFNMTGVRQALAYVINRPKVNELQAAGPSVNPTDQVPDGLLTTVQNQWLSRAQIKSLNPYDYDPAKAAKLLKSLGFQKKNSEWMMPNGKPFTVTVDGPAGWGGPMLMQEAIAHMLSGFGIKATVNATEQPGYWTYQETGNFQVDWGWGDENLDPLSGMGNVLVNENYANTGTYRGDPGIGFGPTETLPGIGKVNVSRTLSQESSDVGPGPKMRKLTWDWARLVDQQLPYLSILDGVNEYEYSSTHFTHWPPASSPIWKITGINTNGGLVLAMEKGYIRPVS